MIITEKTQYLDWSDFEYDDMNNIISIDLKRFSDGIPTYIIVSGKTRHITFKYFRTRNGYKRRSAHVYNTPQIGIVLLIKLD